MKFDKRELLGPLFKPLSKARHSKTLRISTAILILPGQIIRARLNLPYFPVDIKGRKGMGALLRDAIQICNYAEQNKLVPRISSTNPLYSSNQDVIQTYFGPESMDHTPGLRPLKYLNKWSFFHLKFAKHISIREASRIFWVYLSPKLLISDKVNAVLDGVPNGEFDLSVHYRGTDKVREAPMVSFSVFKDEIVRYQNDHGALHRVFLATDEPVFERYIRDEFPGVVFQTYNLGTPGNTATGRHFSSIKEEDKATEAIVNMFLLARAPCLIRSSSHMSAMSKIINPGIRTITLNRTHWG
ncbi:MAG: hypothetical protein ACXVIY_05585, partial [Mucilaginibacter sp.]